MPSSRDLPDPGIKPMSLMSPAPARGFGFFTTSATWEHGLFWRTSPAVCPPGQSQQEQVYTHRHGDLQALQIPKEPSRLSHGNSDSCDACANGIDAGMGEVGFLTLDFLPIFEGSPILRTKTQSQKLMAPVKSSRLVLVWLGSMASQRGLPCLLLGEAPLVPRRCRARDACTKSDSPREASRQPEILQLSMDAPSP